ncbi:MAG: hypothetical protein QOF19_726 [Alphaproteobacteria bacterium]|jgi:hypothetical protein|nr:hypothetical protein [Alphaproteobacteria bacterium]
MPDKILIANIAALKKKYGDQGVQKIVAAIKTLIAADKDRGLKTQMVDISDAGQMKKYKGSAVSTATSERQCKDAVDAIYAATKADYLVLLDGPDVLPHLALNNPTPGDKDKNVPSDLPYASDAPFTKRDAAAYAAVTRVVGRIPGVTGANDPAFLLSQIKGAAAFKSRKRDDYLANFAISASVWQKSTAESVDNIFGSKTIKICPPTGSPSTRKMLAPLSHFINCHGGEVDPQFYGQHGQQYPVSMTSEDVAKGAKRNTIVAAECCFGAQLFDPNWADGKWPICNAYLNAGAIAFFGSTTTAYGPEEGNGSADLIAQYFLINILASASIGRACLQARQKFVQGQKMEDPVNLKTLAQFILLADPSLRAVVNDTPHAKQMSKMVDHREARKTRRIALVAFGKAAADSSGFPGKKITRKTNLHKLVNTLARQRGFRVKADAIEAYEIVGGDGYHEEMKARGVQQKVLVVTDRSKTSKKKTTGVPLTRILVAHAQDNRVIDLSEYIRR